MAYGGRLEAFVTVPSATTVTATNAGGGPTSVSLTAGSYSLTLFLVHLIARLNAVRTGGTWSGSISTGSSGTGLVTLNCTGGAWAITFTTATVGTLLGFVGDIGSGSVAVTGTQNCRGLWLPDCPLQLDLEPLMAPKVTDSRGTESPSGYITTYTGTYKYEHTALRYSHVPQHRATKAHETTTYASLQSWIDDTQYQHGHTWFGVGSTFHVYWANAGTDTIVGYELNTNTGPTYGWGFSPAVNRFGDHVKRVDANWNGVWSVVFDRLVSRG